jgi:hypothetical protein
MIEGWATWLFMIAIFLATEYHEDEPPVWREVREE